MRPSTKDILNLLAENASADFEYAKTLPPAIYHDPDILRLETERLFYKDWICLGRLAEIPKTGDYLCRDIVDSPVFIVRQRDQTVRAFANVCVHRSARLLQSEGHVSRISCPYHSWTYGIDGQLIGAPFMQQTANFEVAAHRLKELRCESWEGFVYVSLDPDAASIGEQLSGLTDRIAGFRIADYVPVFSREETWDTNWKCLVENYMDAYHIHRVHKDSFGKYGSSEEHTELFDGEDAYSFHCVEEKEGPKSVHAHPDNTWLEGPDRNRTYLINIFPGHTIQLQPDMLWYLSILPDGQGKVSIRWAVSIPAEILDGAKDRQAHIDAVMALLHQVNSEDLPIVENVFRTTRSPNAEQGPLSYLERNVWQFGRYLARRLCP
jgi:phenylpropionate dioxygenase-like ring-hydroxylating dioxygenase large terminal subunit